jgi:S-(hydroxymethyl)glutathione dehydrogenase/alcohol dehydrogenase
VCACDVHENKRRRAELAGADFVNLSREKIAGKFDLVLDTAGNPEAMDAALGHLAPSGRYVMIGQPPPGKPVCISNARHLFDGEGKSIRATQGGGFRPDLDIPRYLRAAELLSVHRLVTHRFPLDRINQALDCVRAGEAGRVLLEISKP